MQQLHTTMIQYGTDYNYVKKATKKQYRDEDDFNMDFIFLSNVMMDHYPIIHHDTTNPLTETRDQRIGQEEFRRQLLKRYNGCVVTQNTHVVELEAAHLMPHRDGRDQSIDNGIILEANLHKTFDQYQWSIDPHTLKIVTNGSGSIENYRGRVVYVHENSKAYLNHHYMQYLMLKT